MSLVSYKLTCVMPRIMPGGWPERTASAMQYLKDVNDVSVRCCCCLIVSCCVGCATGCHDQHSLIWLQLHHMRSCIWTQTMQYTYLLCSSSHILMLCCLLIAS
jgi:hypothetical protein